MKNSNITSSYNPVTSLDRKVCSRARRTKDKRFDGLFFLGVKTTGIYCRPICPVMHVKEENITYYKTAIDAAQAGYRPCLRCRPDAAPGSPEWRGVSTILEQALLLIKEGYLQDHTMQGLAQRLGIGDRYLRKLFQEHLGVSPKTYALYHQCLFAKTLIQTTNLSIINIAYASGFNSLRRFNDEFKNRMGLSPREIRRKKSKPSDNNTISIHLSYRPPYNWEMIHAFYAARLIDCLEWVDENSYGRTFKLDNTTGKFNARHNAKKNGFDVEITVNELSRLKVIVDTIKRLLDLDADSEAIDQVLHKTLGKEFNLNLGVRLPGVWDTFECGIRAILGQQISVVAAHKYCKQLIKELGEPIDDYFLFPSPKSIAASDLAFLRIPNSKRQTLIRFAQHYSSRESHANPETWMDIKGIGTWTINYAKIRAQGLPDVYMGNDLGISKMEKRLSKSFSPATASPWRSYLTVQLWQQL